MKTIEEIEQLIEWMHSNQYNQYVIGNDLLEAFKQAKEMEQNQLIEQWKKDETIAIQKELIDLLMSQVIDLSMMSKIELGDDVLDEIKRLKKLLE